MPGIYCFYELEEPGQPQGEEPQSTDSTELSDRKGSPYIKQSSQQNQISSLSRSLAQALELKNETRELRGLNITGLDQQDGDGDRDQGNRDQGGREQGQDQGQDRARDRARDRNTGLETDQDKDKHQKRNLHENAYQTSHQKSHVLSADNDKQFNERNDKHTNKINDHILENVNEIPASTSTSSSDYHNSPSPVPSSSPVHVKSAPGSPGPTKSVLDNVRLRNKTRRRSSLCYSETAQDLGLESDPNPTTSFQICTSCRSDALAIWSEACHSPRSPELPLPDKIPNSPKTPSQETIVRPALFAPISPPGHRRKPSFVGHGEPLVGSYEESLLSGRMSAPSSPPVPFFAKIGVLGTSKSCPDRLKFPRHISTSFDAVFYDWNINTTKSSPGTPYVGVVSLDSFYKSHNNHPPDSAKPPRFPGYKIPCQGQIQIVISNAQKTAVKLFLVPYDLSKMPTGHKTFFRQKTVEVQDVKEAKSKRTLIQAVHLQIASPSRKKYYLYGDIRLVFQNRAIGAPPTIDQFNVPHKNSKLRVETVHGTYSAIPTANVCSHCSGVLNTPSPIPRTRYELDTQMLQDMNSSLDGI